jgi:cytochrome c biogenesis protein CcmG/thiol:disulfide interchange protein DsbE
VIALFVIKCSARFLDWQLLLLGTSITEAIVAVYAKILFCALRGGEPTKRRRALVLQSPMHCDVRRGIHKRHQFVFANLIKRAAVRSTFVLAGLIGFLLVPVLLFGQRKTDFRAESIDGKEITLSELYSKGPTLVTFWALWCIPCREEMKHLRDIYRAYHDSGFSILSINQDSPKSVSKVRAYVASQRMEFPVVLDPNSQYLQKFNGQSIPFALLYDRRGNVAYRQIGYLPGDENKLLAQIRKLLTNKSDNE